MNRRHPRDPTPRATSLAGALLILAVATLAGGCGGDSGGPVSAGAGRNAPADGGSVYFDDVADGGGQPDVSGSDVPGPDTSGSDARTEPPDRILREGAVGTVTVVTDGDTVHVTVDGWYHRVRIQGINAPECDKTLNSTQDGREYTCSSDDEYWGLASGNALEGRALNRQVTVFCNQAPGQPCPIDTFDRPLAFLEDAEGDLGEWMARNGHAFSFTKFSSTRRATYCAAEDQAIAAERGMWALGDPDEVLSRMNNNTQDWYDDRDRRCADATR